MKHMKKLGFLAFAAMALVAFVGTASASAASFETGATEAALSTTTLSQHVFTVTGTPVKCNVSKFEGETEALTATHQKVHPVYEGCEAFGFTEGVSVNTGSAACKYDLQAAGGVIVEGCASGITITVSNIFATCVVNVPNQTIASAVSYANNGNNIVVTANASEIEANVTTSSGLCPLKTGVHSGAAGATYTGQSEVSAAGTFLKFIP